MKKLFLLLGSLLPACISWTGWSRLWALLQFHLWHDQFAGN